MKTTIQYLEEGIFLLDSNRPGPTISLVGGIHGDEPCGVTLLDYIKANLEITTGKIYGIYGNLDAIERNIRQCDVNLNRIFRDDFELSEGEKNSKEYAHMNRIKKYLTISEICLDIHSSPTPGSPVFAIGEENTFAVAKNLPVEYVCSGFSNVEAGGTDYYMYMQGKIGICLECGYHNHSSAFINAKKGLYAVLVSYGMIESKVKQDYTPKYMQAKKAYITRTNAFKISKYFYDFERINQGDIIGFDGESTVYSENNGYILFARDRKRSGVEAFIELVQV